MIQTENKIFSSLPEVLAYYKNKNPARQRFPNLLEPERGGERLYREHFSGSHSDDIWAKIVKGLQHVKRYVGNDDFDVFWYSDIERINQIDIAAKLGHSERVIRRILKRVRQEAEVEFVLRDLLPRHILDL